VVDWSWDLLSEPERALWRRFTVFHGGADLTAVERVCTDDIIPSARSMGWPDGLDLLGALVDKSLLVLADGRYRMLETIREYGRERLAEAGETERMRRAHAGHLLAVATEAEPHLRSGEQLIWLRRLAADHDNLHAAVRAAVEAGDTATAMALVARLGWYWWLSGHRAEGMALSRDVLRLTGDADPEDRALAYTFATLNGLEGGTPMDEVVAWFHEAERLGSAYRGAHPALRLIGPLSFVFRNGWAAFSFGELQALFEDPDPWLRAVARMMSALMRLNFGQDPAVAEAEMRAALTGFQAIGERWGIGFSLSSLSDLAAARGDTAQALRWQREALALVREVGLREDVPQMEIKLAHQIWMSGDRAEARRMLKQARASAEEVGLPEVMASIEYGHATIARAGGDLEEADRRLTTAWSVLADGSAAAPQFRAMIASTRGLVAAETGDLDRARRLHADAVRTSVGSNDAPVVALTLVGAADLALRTGDPVRAARLFGASIAVRGSVDHSLPDADRVEREARAALGDPGFEAAYRAGLLVTVATAVEAAGLDAAPERPHAERGEHHQQDGGPDQ
jgi:hypothetical protein